MDRLFAPTEWKAADASGSLVGYASTFGNVDLGGDVVAPGAFAQSLAAVNVAGLPLLADHMATTDRVLGTIFHAEENDHGLVIRARFASTDDAQRVRTKMLEGHLSKLSIGYEALDDHIEDRDGQRVRVLDRVRL